jgi:polar amino acid transport system permease protein
MIKNFLIIADHWSDFAVGLGNTIWICVVAATISVLAGLVGASALVSKNQYVRVPMRLIVDWLRCIPFLLLVYMAYYGLPVIGLYLNSWTAGLLTLTVYNTAYISEILRGAWSHLPPEQEEAGRAVGHHGLLLFIRIIAPQLYAAAGPVIGNQLIILTKDSAFLMIITVPELTFVANSIQTNYYMPFEVYLVTILLYWGICRLIEIGVKHVEAISNRWRLA